MRPTLIICFGVCGVLLAQAVIPASAVEKQLPPLPSTKRFLSDELRVCDMGSFWIGGVPKVTASLSQIIVGQMYTQFVIPPKHRKWPLILTISGSGALYE